MRAVVGLAFFRFLVEDPFLFTFLFAELLILDDDLQFIEEIGLILEGLLIDMKE